MRQPAAHAARSVACDAPAKINLALHVTGRREDGYHLLDTVAVFAGTADRLEIRPSSTTALEIAGPFAGGLAASGDNLVLRAAGALAPRLSCGVSFRLTKNLPVASGIGGGSADAAAALRLLGPLCDPVPSREELEAIALGLGADVPMCLSAMALRATGIGEEIETLPEFPPLFLLLVNPGVAVPTGEIFRRLGGRFGKALPEPGGLRDLAGLFDWLCATRNDLEAPAAEAAPAIGEVLALLRGLPGCRAARMSGSGATCFGVFADSEGAERAAALLRGQRPGWWVAATRTRTAAPEAIRTGG